MRTCNFDLYDPEDGTPLPRWLEAGGPEAQAQIGDDER